MEVQRSIAVGFRINNADLDRDPHMAGKDRMMLTANGRIGDHCGLFHQHTFMFTSTGSNAPRGYGAPALSGLQCRRHGDLPGLHRQQPVLANETPDLNFNQCGAEPPYIYNNNYLQRRRTAPEIRGRVTCHRSDEGPGQGIDFNRRRWDQPPRQRPSEATPPIAVFPYAIFPRLAHGTPRSLQQACSEGQKAKASIIGRLNPNFLDQELQRSIPMP